MIELCCVYFSKQCIWLYVHIMSRTCFRVNPHSRVAWMTRNSLLKNMYDIWSLSDCNGTRIQNHLVRKRTPNHLTKQAKWLSCDMIRTYSQMHLTDKYTQHSSVYWPVCLKGWLFVYRLSGCGFKSRCSHLNLRYRVCFEQGVPWHSDNSWEWIYSVTRTWHDKNIQWSKLFLKVSNLLIWGVALWLSNLFVSDFIQFPFTF